MAELANLGFKVDTSGLQKGEKALDSYARKGEQVEKTTGKNAKAMGDFGKKAGQAGIQFEQLIGSINAGQNPLRALGFQATDLGFVLGFPLVGAIAGISASMASVLIPALLSGGKAVEDFTFDVEKLKDSLDDLNELTKSQLSVGVIEANKRMGELSKQAKEQAKIVADLSKQLDNNAKITQITSTFGAKLTTTQALTKEETKNLSEELVQERANLDSINQEYEAQSNLLVELNNQINQINKSKTESGKLSKSERDALEGVNNSIRSQIIALEKGEEAAFKFNLAKQFKDNAIPEQTQILVDNLFKIRKEQEKLAADKKAVDFFEKQKLALAGLNEELQVLNIRQQGLSLGLGDDKINELVEIAEKQQQIKQDLESSKELEGLINKVNDFGGAWTNTGNIIVDSFGNMSNALNDYMKRLDGLGALRDDLAKMEVKHGASDKRVIEARAALNEKEVQASVGGFKTMSGAFSKMFKENSKEREAFHKLEVALTAVEIALSFQRALAYAKEALAGASAAPFPLGFAGFAGMAAIMAGLGLFGGGSSGGVDVEEKQKKQGTGTVLGSDSKTESITRNIQLLADISVDQLFELKGLRDATIELSNSIEKLAVAFVRDVDFDLGKSESSELTAGGKLAKSSIAASVPFIDPLGLIDFNKIFSAIGGVKKTVEDQGILFLSQTLSDIVEGGINAVKFIDIRRKEKALGVTISDKIKRTTDGLNEDIIRDMSLIFENIQFTIEESVRALGFNVDGVLDSFKIEEFELSIKGLSGEEIQKEIEAVFGKQADLMSKFVIDLKEFQKIGEGAYETLVRVSYEQAVFNEFITKMGFALNKIGINETQNVINIFGGIGEFAEKTNSFTENFLTNSEKMKHQADSFNAIFNKLGLSFTDNRQSFAQLVKGLDLTTESGQEMFATLMNISPALSDYIGELEQIEERRSSLNVELLRAQGKEQEALNEQRRLELDAMDESLRGLQYQVWAEQDRAKAIADTTRELESSNSKLESFSNRIKTSIGSNIISIDKALSAARVGDFATAEKLNISKALSLNSDSFNNSKEMLRKQIENQSKLSEIANLAENQISENEKQITELTGIKDGVIDLTEVIYHDNQMIFNSNNEIQKEVSELKSNVVNILETIAKNTKETAENTDNIYEDGIEVRQA